MANKILIIPPNKWYMEAQAEYLIRHLSDEFFMEIAHIPYPPYANYLERFPDESPFMRNPDDYDILWPLWPGHWGVNQDNYCHKTVVVHYEPGECRWTDVAAVGAATPIAEKHLGDFPHHRLRFGVDTDLFKPYPMVREDNLFHVGMVGSMVNTRHMVKPVIEALKDVSGVRLMLFPSYKPNEQDVHDLGGWDFLSRIVGGEKWFNGFPNVYNQMDVLIRCEQDPGYSFPVPEAMACGVPVIATNSGIEEELLGSGCGIIIDGNRDIHLNHPEITTAKVREAVIRLRDNPETLKLMGDLSRQRIELYWTWDKFINDWREFFRKGIAYATTHSRHD